MDRALVNTPFRSDIVFRNENLLNESSFYTRLTQVSKKEGSLCNLDRQLTYMANLIHANNSDARA